MIPEKVTNGSAFYMLIRTQVDGHDYIKSAIEKGATTIIIEKMLKYLKM